MHRHTAPRLSPPDGRPNGGGRALSPAEAAERRALNNYFFDSSLLTGWLRCEINERFTIRYINAYLVERLSYDSLEALMTACGGSFAALLDPKDNDGSLLAAAQALPPDGDTAFTYRLRTKDGRSLWIREHGHRYVDADGTPMLLRMLIDITDLVHMESRVEEQQRALMLASDELSKERQYQRILDDSTPVGTVILRLGDGELLHVGGTMLRELGYSKEEFRAFQDTRLRGFVLDEDYGTAFRDKRADPDELPPFFEQEYRAVKKDGGVVWLYEKGTLVSLEDGALAYIFVYMDITRRKEMEERLRVGEQELRIAMSQMGKMVCQYDPAARTLTLPEAYARQYGMPETLYDMPQSILSRGVIGEDFHATYMGFFEAIQRGDETGEMEVYLRRADGEWRWEHAEFVSVFGLDGKPMKTILTLEDTTQEHQQENENERLRENERVSRLVASHSNRLIYRYDIASGTTYADSEAAAKAAPIWQNVPETVIESGMLLPESVEDFRRAFREIREGMPEGSARLHIHDAEGRPHWVDMRYSLVDAHGGTPKTAVLSFLDITEAHERELAFERYQQTIEQDTAAGAGIIFLEADITADVTEKNGGDMLPAGFPPAGSSRSEVIDFIADNFVLPEESERCRVFFSREHLITEFSDGLRHLSEQWRIMDPSGVTRWMRSELQMIEDPYTGHIKGYTILRDITEETLAALDVKKQAETDGMTGIYNKATTEALIKERLAVGNAPCALLIADLDDLKSINDKLGHAQGDRALCMTAGLLREQFRQTDIVGRIGGDEFMAFLDGAGNEAKLRSIMTALMRKFSLLRVGEDNDVALHGSVGIAIGKAGRDSFAELYRKADKALYHVKQNGKNDYAFYSPQMDHAAYRYVGHAADRDWRADSLDRLELNRLLQAVSAIYPLVISANLTQNSYYMMHYENYAATVCLNAGCFDELVETGAATFHPDDRASFLAAFSRENLLAAYARGETRVSHTGRQRGDDGVYRLTCTEVVLMQDEKSGDVLEISLGRVVLPEG